MGTVDDLAFAYPDVAERPALAPRRKHRHRWVQVWRDGVVVGTCCASCSVMRDPNTSDRGRRNRQRGNAIEREIGHRLGLRRVGQYGGPDDLAGEMFAAQVKSGASFPERLWSWLRAVPVNAGQTALLVVTDAPGPGHRRRALVVVDIDDWIALHGPTEKEDIDG